MRYDFKISDKVCLCKKTFESPYDVYKYALEIGADEVRQNYTDYPKAWQDTFGSHGEWMTLAEVDSAIYEYYHN
jgi:hypothetical protein